MPIHDWTRVPAEIFLDFRATWFPEIKRALNAGVLPAGYYVLIEQIAGGAEASNLSLDRPIISSHVSRNGLPRNALVVRRVLGDKVVAVIEIVAPANKLSGYAVSTFAANAAALLRAGINLQVVDLFPPGLADPQGMHDAIWSAFGDAEFELPANRPLIVASYATHDSVCAYMEPTAVGIALPELPLFLEQESYVKSPLETSYLSAFAGVPDGWREVLESSPG